MTISILAVNHDHRGTRIEGVTDDNRPVLIDYDSGYLSIEVGTPGQNLDAMFDEYLVFDEEVATACPIGETITNEEVKKVLESFDFNQRLAEAEKLANERKKLWHELFNKAKKFRVGEVSVCELSLSNDLPWTTPSRNRSGPLYFDQEFMEYLKPDVGIYFYTDQQLGSHIVNVFVSKEYEHLDAEKLAKISCQPFGGTSHGTGGARSARFGCCQSPIDEEQALQLIIDEISK